MSINNLLSYFYSVNLEILKEKSFFFFFNPFLLEQTSCLNSKEIFLFLKLLLEHKSIQHHDDFKTELGGTLSMTRCFLLLKNVVLFFSLFSYEFQVKPKNPLGEGPPSNTVAFSTESGNCISWNSQQGYKGSVFA